MSQHGRHTATPYLVLVVSVLLTLSAATYSSKYGAEQDQLKFKQVVEAQGAKISEALDDRIALLRGVEGLFAARSSVTSEEFHMYAARISNYPDVRAIGYAARIKDADTDHYPTTHLEGSDKPTGRDLGLDLLADPVIRPALEAARDSALPAISDRWIHPPVDEPTFLLCLPKYALAASLETVEGRREGLEGFVFAFIRPDRLTQGTLGAKTGPAISVNIFNGSEENTDRLLYSTSVSPTWTPFTAQ